MDEKRLETRQLTLVAATPALLDAELESPAHLAALLKAQVEPGWPPGEYDRAAQEFFRRQMEKDGTAGWLVWYAIRRGTPEYPAVLVGAGGYGGPPDRDGGVEIGFSVLPGWQKRGYATEMARALIENAFSESKVEQVVAHTTEDNTASRRVLEKSGFVMTGTDNGQLRYEVRQRPAGSVLIIPRG
jgi:RimJ/RimL family protein N-acetyltransferase